MSAFRVFAAERETSYRVLPRNEAASAGAAPTQPAADRIAVRESGRVILLKVDDIDWIEAADNYVCLHRGTETHVLRETMNAVEARLPSQFVRIHRSAIVNLDRVKELQPWFRGDYQVILRDGTKLTLTKNHRKKLHAQLLLGSFTR